MPFTAHRARHWRFEILIVLASATTAALAQLTIPNTPLSVRQNAKPLVMLVASKEHRLFYEAYNDASDIDGDGALDIRFKPSITYLGLFNPNLCYEHDGKSDNTGLFTPFGRAAGSARTCSGKWSGNWLNYVTTSRIDALRVVLYGGMREVDTPESTILRRAYIPQDAHSWAKEYTSEAIDGYKISDYTPLSAPALERRHFFGNLTRVAGVNCTTLNNCSDRPPLLSVVTNSRVRVWQWASTERPVLSSSASTHRGTLNEYTVRVSACAIGYTEGCKAYGTTTPTYKPVGLLHEFGEKDALLFGLLTGSYDRNLSGGRLRKVVTSFQEEVIAATGVFKSGAAIVGTFDALRIRDFNNRRADNAYRSGWADNRPPVEGEFSDWGNPIGEMMYESLRYFAGKKAPTPAFAAPNRTAAAVDAAVGLPAPAWDDPYDRNSAAKAPRCARANLLVISDTNLSYDSDQVPGADPNFAQTDFTGDLDGLRAAQEAQTITKGEPDVKGERFIGQSGATFDSAPTAKQVDSLGSVRGLAPEEPTKQGSYYSAAVAYFGKRSDLRPDKEGRQSADTFVVALASPLPRIVVPVPGNRQVTLVPFAKTVGGGNTSNAKGSYQPTNQIVDFYVERIANSGPTDRDPSINGGRYEAQFLINYEDMELGADHEMDAVVRYTVTLTADDQVIVRLSPTYAGGGYKHRIGYVISGTEKDGIYLEVQDEADETPYFLNTPPGLDPGKCDVKEVPENCKRLPFLGNGSAPTETERTFKPRTGATATLLKDPLWYAAKWGAFRDVNGNDQPDLPGEWDENGDGVPDAYLPVQNPLKLREALRKTLDNIIARSSSASSLTSNSTRATASTRLYQAIFDTQRWSGDLLAWRITNSGLAATPDWQASQRLPAWQERKIFVHTVDLGVQPLAQNGLPGVSREIVNYLRGDRSQETRQGGGLRDRNNPLGDIVHASPLHDPETDTVYISANDGMLHALNGSDGKELFAFIPQAAAGRIAQQASLTYEHQYLLDGELARAPWGPLTQNRRYLYALLGRGGKGLFSLNVTEPTQFGASDLLWDYSSGASSFGASDRDLGLMLGRPVVTPLNNGKLGVIVGNGYNSDSGKAVLYIFIIAADGRLERVRKIDTQIAGDNGLAGPAILDTNQDGKADVVYAGDLLGNVWRFDIGSTDPAQWGLSLSGTPLFRARDAAGRAQPITAPLFVAVNHLSNNGHIGKPYVFFGTGAYFRQDDPADRSVQSWYGLVDDGTAIATGRAALRQRSIMGTGVLAGVLSRTFSMAAEGDLQGLRGWYLDLSVAAAGERTVTAAQIARLAVPALVVSSLVPINDDPCVAGGRGFVNFLDPFTGGALTVGVIDVNGDGDFSNDKLGDRLVGSVDMGVGLPSEVIFLRRANRTTTAFISGSGGSDPQSLTAGAGIGAVIVKSATQSGRRIVWREIIKD